MFNNPYQNSGSYFDLLKQMTQRVKQQKIDDQILETLQQAFEKELGLVSIVLSRPERVYLFRQITMEIMIELLKKLDDLK